MRSSEMLKSLVWQGGWITILWSNLLDFRCFVIPSSILGAGWSLGFFLETLLIKFTQSISVYSLSPFNYLDPQATRILPQGLFSVRVRGVVLTQKFEMPDRNPNLKRCWQRWRPQMFFGHFVGGGGHIPSCIDVDPFSILRDCGSWSIEWSSEFIDIHGDMPFPMTKLRIPLSFLTCQVFISSILGFYIHAITLRIICKIMQSY